MRKEDALKIDIWNKIVLNDYANAISPAYFAQPRGSSNYISSENNQKVEGNVHALVADYTDIDDLYVLDLELNIIIREIADFIFLRRTQLSKKSVQLLFSTLQERYPEVETVIDFKKLASEVVKEGKKDIVVGSDRYTDYKAPIMMKKLAMLQKSTQNRIEQEICDHKIKAEAFLKSYGSIRDMTYCHDEILIYLLKRDIETSKVKKEALSRWKIFQKEWQNMSSENDNSFCQEFVANALRISQFKTLSHLRNALGRKSQLKKMPHTNYISDFYGVFTLLRTDVSISLMDQKVKILLDKLENMLKKIMDSNVKQEFYSEEHFLMSQLLITMSATFLFGHRRIQNSSCHKNVINDITQYLLYHLDLYMSYYSKNIKRLNFDAKVIAMAIHAICITDPPGWVNPVSASIDLLLKQQNRYGYWERQNKRRPSEISDCIETTVFVLDAIELANGGTQVTFDITSIKEKLLEFRRHNHLLI